MPSTSTEMLTAREYLERYERGVLDIMLDADIALKHDEKIAYAVATRLQQPCRFDEKGLATSEAVWQIVYP